MRLSASSEMLANSVSVAEQLPGPMLHSDPCSLGRGRGILLLELQSLDGLGIAAPGRV